MLAALKCQSVDRVPVKVWGATPDFKIIHPSFEPILQAALDKTDLVVGWGMPGGTFLSDTDQVTVRTERRPSDVADYDEQIQVYETPAGPLTSVSHVSTIGRPGYVKKHLIETEEDAKRFLSIPYVPVRGDTSGFAEACEKLGDRGIVMAGFGEPMYSINALMGSETFAFWSVEHRELLHELFSTMYERIRDRIEYQLERGVGPVYGYVGPELCIPPLASPADFREFVVAYDRKLIDLIHANDGIVWCHSHGNMGSVLEDFAAMGVDTLNPLEPPPMGDVTLAEAKARIGDRVALEGNIEKGDLYRAEPEHIRELVRQAMRDMAPGDGFILCPTSGFQEWSEASDRYVQNYLAYIDEGIRAGRYPIDV